MLHINCLNAFKKIKKVGGIIPFGVLEDNIFYATNGYVAVKVTQPLHLEYIKEDLPKFFTENELLTEVDIPQELQELTFKPTNLVSTLEHIYFAKGSEEGKIKCLYADKGGRYYATEVNTQEEIYKKSVIDIFKKHQECKEYKQKSRFKARNIQDGIEILKALRIETYEIEFTDPLYIVGGSVEFNYTAEVLIIPINEQN